MAITPALFKVRFPEFDTVADDRIQLFLDDAALVMDAGVWGDVYDLGQSYLAAHYLALANKSAGGSSGSVSGPIASRSVDGVSVSYAGSPSASTSANAGYYSTTSYGQRYMTLLKNLGVAASVV